MSWNKMYYFPLCDPSLTPNSTVNHNYPFRIYPLHTLMSMFWYAICTLKAIKHLWLMKFSLCSLPKDVIQQTQDMYVDPNILHYHLWNIWGHIHVPYLILPVSITSSSSPLIWLYSYLRRNFSDLTELLTLKCIMRARHTCIVLINLVRITTSNT